MLDVEGRRARRIAWLAAVAAAALVAAAPPPAAAGEIATAAAIWKPDADFMKSFHARCDDRRGMAFTDCFAAAMAKDGASQAALDFTRRLGNEAYLQALEPSGGAIAIARVFYPFRANENEAWLLVNGIPSLIDVDDRRNLPLAQMRASPTYAKIYRRYPNVSFWPGDRGRSRPEILRNGREIMVDYLLRDLCHACAVIGRVRYAFNFGAAGRFLGTRLVLVSPDRK